MLWPPDVKSWLTGIDPDTGKDWRREEKGTTEDEVVGWHHWLNVHEFEQAPAEGERQGGLGCCRPCGHWEQDTEHLNSNSNAARWKWDTKASMDPKHDAEPENADAKCCAPRDTFCRVQNSRTGQLCRGTEVRLCIWGRGAGGVGGGGGGKRTKGEAWLGASLQQKSTQRDRGHCRWQGFIPPLRNSCPGCPWHSCS